MSDLCRLSLRGDFRARIVTVLPGASMADLGVLDQLIAGDRLIDDDGAPHPDLLRWVQRILDRDADGAMAGPIVPRPITGPAMAEVMA